MTVKHVLGGGLNQSAALALLGGVGGGMTGTLPWQLHVLTLIPYKWFLNCIFNLLFEKFKTVKFLNHVYEVISMLYFH